MKALKLTAIAVALISTSAMANVVTDTTKAVSHTASSVVDGGKTLFKTFSNPAAVSVEAGTLGYGANIAWSVNPKTELQAGWAGGDLLGEALGDIDVDDINYKVEQDFSNPYLGVNLRPAGNWLTVGTGVIIPENKINLKASPKAGTYKIEGVEVNAAELGNLSGTIEYKNSVAPYLTVGFRPNSNNRFGVFAEVGAAYTGKPRANVTSDKADNARLTKGYATVGQAMSLANAELKNEIEKEDLAEWYPIVKLGATVRF